MRLVYDLKILFDVMCLAESYAFSSAERHSTRGTNSKSNCDYCGRCVASVTLTMSGMAGDITYQLIEMYLFISALLLLITASSACGETVLPEALLLGVEQSRLTMDSFEASVEVEMLAPSPRTLLRCEFYVSNNRRRVDIWSGKSLLETIVREDDNFFAFRRGQHEDLQMYDLDRASGVRGDLLFDPRALGLSDIMPCTVDVTSCLWSSNRAKLEIVGNEAVNGTKTWRLKATKPNGTSSEYWIEEPGFRVHKRTIESTASKIEIVSEFGTDPTDSVFPRRVFTERIVGNTSYKRIYTLKYLNALPNVDPDQFTVSSLDLPINTMANDYRISRIVGYWDGEGWSENPVYFGERPDSIEMPQSQSGFRLGVLFLNLLLVLFLAFFVWRKRHTRST